MCCSAGYVFHMTNSLNLKDSDMTMHLRYLVVLSILLTGSDSCLAVKQTWDAYRTATVKTWLIGMNGKKTINGQGVLTGMGDVFETYCLAALRKRMPGHEIWHSVLLEIRHQGRWSQMKTLGELDFVAWNGNQLDVVSAKINGKSYDSRKDAAHFANFTAFAHGVHRGKLNPSDIGVIVFRKDWKLKRVRAADCRIAYKLVSRDSVEDKTILFSDFLAKVDRITGIRANMKSNELAAAVRPHVKCVCTSDTATDSKIRATFGTKPMSRTLLMTVAAGKVNSAKLTGNDLTKINQKGNVTGDGSKGFVWTQLASGATSKRPVSRRAGMVRIMDALGDTYETTKVTRKK